MAKGDQMGNAPGAPGAMAPKMDQYSVMHKIMDNLGMQSAAPSQGAMGNLAQAGAQMGGRFGTQPIPMNSGGMQPSAPLGQYSNDWSSSIPSFGSTEPTGIVPSNPQEMIRRTMTGNNGMRMG